ncbi:MAG: hypothetical protein GXO75_10965 [Calditrichaeota bacterium]|nr:hypothetical protein [Calditrichota bacterium]
MKGKMQGHFSKAGKNSLTVRQVDRPDIQLFKFETAKAVLIQFSIKRMINSWQPL